jgi:hypothetical protein
LFVELFAALLTCPQRRLALFLQCAFTKITSYQTPGRLSHSYHVLRQGSWYEAGSFFVLAADV